MGQADREVEIVVDSDPKLTLLTTHLLVPRTSPTADSPSFSSQ